MALLGGGVINTKAKGKNKRLKVSLLCMSIAGEVQRMVPSCKGRNKILKEFL
jgi:hypothetical protein